MHCLHQYRPQLLQILSTADRTNQWIHGFTKPAVTGPGTIGYRCRADSWASECCNMWESVYGACALSRRPHAGNSVMCASEPRVPFSLKAFKALQQLFLVGSVLCAYIIWELLFLVAWERRIIKFALQIPPAKWSQFVILCFFAFKCCKVYAMNFKLTAGLVWVFGVCCCWCKI